MSACTVLRLSAGTPVSRASSTGALVSVRPETINRRIRELRQLLEQAGHAIRPGPYRLACLDDL